MNSSLIAAERARAEAVFAHHLGNGPAVPGYGATSWRKWLICAAATNVYYVVPKADPTAKPKRYPNWPLASVKAALLEG